LPLYETAALLNGEGANPLAAWHQSGEVEAAS